MTALNGTVFQKFKEAVVLPTVRAMNAVAKPFHRKHPMEEKPQVVRIWANGFRMDVEGDKLVFTTSSPISGRDIKVEIPKKC